jgi:acyl-CoA synthetase (NDP forming)
MDPMAETSLPAIVAAARAEGRAVLLETEGMSVLDGLGIATPARLFVADSGEAERADLETIPGSDVVLKIVSGEILHKSEVGGVRVLPKERRAVAEAIRSMERRLAGRGRSGFLLAERIQYDPALGGELLLGLRWTEDFGPVVTFGPGGIHTEFLADHLRPGCEVAILSPRFASPEGIRRALEGKAITPLVTGGLRGREARLEGDALVELLSRFLDFAVEHAPAELLELEINPLVLTARGPVALDALARLAPADGSVPRPRPAPRPLEKLEKLLRPGSVAVVGVSDRPNPGNLIVRNLLRDGFPTDRIHVIKPGRDEFLGCPCHPDLHALPEPVDVLVLSVAAAQVPAAIEVVIERRQAETMIVIPGGLGETAGSQALVDRAEAALAASRRTDWGGPLINGGNCLGIRSKPGRYDTLFIPRHKLPSPQTGISPVALISQSGALAVARASKLSGLNPRYILSVGNQIDLTVGDYLTYLEGDREVEVFACYVEGFRPGDGLPWLEAASRITASGRTVILYRAGRTEAGRAASASHTASIAGDYPVTRELAAQAGVTVAESLADFEDLALTFGLLRGREAKGMRLGALSNAGFECVGFADHLGDFTLPTLTRKTTSRIDATLERSGLGGVVEVRNPMDVTPILADAEFEDIARAVLEDDGVDVGVVGCVPLTGALHTLPGGEGHEEDLSSEGSIVSRLARVFRASSKPWVAVVDGGALYDPMARALEERGIPTFRTADRALRALGAFCRSRGFLPRVVPPGGSD